MTNKRKLLYRVHVLRASTSDGGPRRARRTVRGSQPVPSTASIASLHQPPWLRLARRDPCVLTPRGPSTANSGAARIDSGAPKRLPPGDSWWSASMTLRPPKTSPFEASWMTPRPAPLGDCSQRPVRRNSTACCPGKPERASAHTLGEHRAAVVAVLVARQFVPARYFCMYVARWPAWSLVGRALGYAKPSSEPRRKGNDG